MATVTPGEKRFRQGHYGLYKTRLGGDESVIVRRQHGQPTDWMHEHSRPVALQRRRFALATKHYTHLTPTQKRRQRDQIGFVDRQSSPSRTVVLSGRQLFISLEIRELLTKGIQLLLPYEVCIILCDPDHRPLIGFLDVLYLENGQWHSVPGHELAAGHWLFGHVPRHKESYRVEGHAGFYIDPKLPATQFMTPEQLVVHHYHVLHPAAILLLLEEWHEMPEPAWTEHLLEQWLPPDYNIPWTEHLLEHWHVIPDIEWTLHLVEQWLPAGYDIPWTHQLLEQWLAPGLDPTWVNLLRDPWYGPLPQPTHTIRHFELWAREPIRPWLLRLLEKWNPP